MSIRVVKLALLAATMASLSGTIMAAEGAPEPDIGLGGRTDVPGAPAAAPPMAVPAPGIPTPAPLGDPGLPVLPMDTTAVPGAAGAVPTPPPLTGLIPAADAAGTTDTTMTITAPQGPIDTYEFLFQDDEELGIMRQQYTYADAQRAKEAEITRFMEKYRGAPGQQPQYQVQPGMPPEADPARAGAEWDLYYEQLELYSDYIREQVLQGLEDLPEPSYDAGNYLQDRTDLKNEYDKAAIAALNVQQEENRDFYDRLQKREDRRRRYYDWLAETQQDLDDWAKIWSRKVNGQRWMLADEAVRRDDWYYGVNFVAPDAKLVQIDGQRFLFSQDAQPNVPADTINVISSNLTPYDVIDRNGDVKRPELEMLRGTLVHAPVEAPTTGTVELVP